MTGLRARLLAVVAAATLVTPGCGALRDDVPDALTSLSGQYRVFGAVVGPKYADFYGAGRFIAHRTVTLRSFVPAAIPPGVTVLGVRATFLRSWLYPIAGAPGEYCVPWPWSKDYGYQVDDLVMQPRDDVEFSVYVRADRPSDYVVGGHVLTYDEGGHRRTVRHEGRPELALHAMGPGERNPLHACESRASERLLPR